MSTYIALLRGINVGGKNILPMKDLLEIFKEMGFTDVNSYIQSGNVVFHSRTKCSNKTAVEVASRIEDRHGIAPTVLLLAASELAAALENNPYEVQDGKTVHFYFLSSIPKNPDLQRLIKVKTASEAFKLGGRIFYLHAPDGIGRSKLAAAVEQSLGVVVTARNLNTVNKLISMV
jgi:uncharacterized protein (DUF1697 family)